MSSEQKNWNVEDIILQIKNLTRECSSPYNDGLSGWYLKQDLYLIKDTLESCLKQSPKFGNIEEEWLLEKEKNRIIKILKS